MEEGRRGFDQFFPITLISSHNFIPSTV